MFTTAIGILFIAGGAITSPLANQYFDSVLNTALRTEVQNLHLNPAELSDFSTEFRDHIKGLGNVKVNADFKKGTLKGLTDVHRASECQGPYYVQGVKSLNCSILFNNLQIEYDGKLKYGKIPKVGIKGKANVTSTMVFVEVTSMYQAVPPTVKNFLFQQTGYMSIKYSGLGPVNSFIKFLDQGFKPHVEAQIFNIVGQRYQNALNRAVAYFPLPN